MVITHQTIPGFDINQRLKHLMVSGINIPVHGYIDLKGDKIIEDK